MSAVVFVNVPENLEVGIDSICWDIKSGCFDGFKLIEEGLHFIYWKVGSSLERIGFWHFFEGQSLIALKWIDGEIVVLDPCDR